MRNRLIKNDNETLGLGYHTVMRYTKVRNLVVLLGLLPQLQGCSFLVDMVFFNNSEDSVEVCNLNLIEPSCQVVMAKSLSKMRIVGDRPESSWRISISQGNKKGIYKLVFRPYPEDASEVYCEGFIRKQCDIPVQYEPSGLLYWGGKNSELPVEVFPNQPRGFPVEPSA